MAETASIAATITGMRQSREAHPKTQPTRRPLQCGAQTFGLRQAALPATAILKLRGSSEVANVLCAGPNGQLKRKELLPVGQLEANAPQK